MQLENVHSVYFLGIGGIGMSALARWFHANGFAVFGYDKTVTPLTTLLHEEGIFVHYDDELKVIPQKVLQSIEDVLIIYTPAIPQQLGIYKYFNEKGYKIYKRSQVLGMLTDAKYTIAVAGTHGKTTTSAMVAHLLKSVGVDCSALVGGIMTNYNSNLLIGTKNDIMVVEADEFDRSFLTLHPDVAIITSMDADHLDIYGDANALIDSFNEFIKHIKPNGLLLVEVQIADRLKLNPNKNITVQTYGLDKAEIVAKNINIKNNCFKFDYQSIDRNITELNLRMPGYHNVSNATAAIGAVSQHIQFDKDIVNGIDAYLGVKRRFEYIIQSKDLVFIDDYAHHPQEIAALLLSVRALYSDSKVTALFQPHLFTRTRDFAEKFAESLSFADEVWLMDIYPARESPIEGVTSAIIKDQIKNIEVLSVTKEKVMDIIQYKNIEVLLTIGAGDIAQLIAPIKEELENR